MTTLVRRFHNNRLVVEVLLVKGLDSLENKMVKNENVFRDSKFSGENREKVVSSQIRVKNITPTVIELWLVQTPLELQHLNFDNSLDPTFDSTSR